MQGLSGARKKLLTPIQVLGGGTGLLWPLLYVSHSVPALLNGVYGSPRWMEQLKSHSGLRERNAAKALPSHASRRNGMLIGIDSRHRDSAGTVREMSGNTLVATLRKIYGEDFLSDWRGDARLSAARQETDMSLNEMVRQHRLGKRLPPPRVGAQRKEYGADFSRDRRSNAKLSKVREETEMSLTELVRRHRRRRA